MNWFLTLQSLATDLIKDSGGSNEALDRGNTFTSEELKRVFGLHTDTLCHTHDLLGCKCLDEKDSDQVEGSGGDDCGSESDSLPDLQDMFQPASQYKPVSTNQVCPHAGVIGGSAS